MPVCLLTPVLLLFNVSLCDVKVNLPAISRKASLSSNAFNGGQPVRPAGGQPESEPVSVLVETEHGRTAEAKKYVPLSPMKRMMQVCNMEGVLCYLALI